MHPELLLGIDMGTGGVRAMAVSADGVLIAEAAVALDPDGISDCPEHHEQSPEAWWRAMCQAIHQVLDRMRSAGHRPEQILALAVDGTSGTLVALDAGGRPLRPAIMYNDPRGSAEAEELNSAAGDFCAKLGYRFSSSYAIAKIAWLRRNEPEVFFRVALFAHQADYAIARLTGRAGVSDYSNALKTGYDLIEEQWPEWIRNDAEIGDRLPEIVPPGTVIGPLTVEAAAATGLAHGVQVVAGATDGTTACLASGLHRPGDYNTTVGTTLVFKGLSSRICRDPQGLIYCHKLPGGLWLPGAASNTGGECLSQWFAGADWPVMDALAKPLLPTASVTYPLARYGERFPFLSPKAQAFFLRPEPTTPIERYASCLQGVAFVERLAYDVLDRATGGAGGDVYSTGAGSRSDVWMQCRADATGRVLHRPECAESGFGAAVLAGAATLYDGLAAAGGRMVRIERSFAPQAGSATAYDEHYQRFCAELDARGYR